MPLCQEVWSSVDFRKPNCAEESSARAAIPSELDNEIVQTIIIENGIEWYFVPLIVGPTQGERRGRQDKKRRIAGIVVLVRGRQRRKACVANVDSDVVEHTLVIRVARAEEPHPGDRSRSPHFTG